MLDVIKSWFRAEGQERITTSSSEKAGFALQLGELPIGTLELREGVWTFRYSPEFQSQLQAETPIQPLVDFPDPKKVYKSTELWPFFMARIPSVSQPKVQREIQTKGLDENSATQLLRAFGERSIANPFVLHPIV